MEPRRILVVNDETARKIETVLKNLVRRPRSDNNKHRRQLRLGGGGGGGSATTVSASTGYIAKLTAEIQYVPTVSGPTRKRYHWTEAEFDATLPGTLQEKVGGRGSKDKLVADLVSFVSGGTNQPTLATPSQGGILYDAMISNGTASIEIVWNKVAGGTDYYCSVGDAGNATKYLTNNALGDVDRVTVSGLPIDSSDIFIELRVDGPVITPNKYKVQISQTGQDLRYIITVAGNSLSDTTQGLWLTPATGSWFFAASLNGDDTYTFTLTFSAIGGAASYLVKTGTTPGAFDIDLDAVVTTTATLNSVPADGSTFYVTILAGAVTNIYAVTIKPPEDKTLIDLEESNLLGDFPTDYTDPPPEVTITDTVYVYVLETLNSGGVPQLVFIHLPLAGFPLARVTGWELIAGTDSRWKYSLRRIVIGDSPTFAVVDAEDADFAVIATDPAINILELTNIAQRTGVQGDSVDQTGTYPAPFLLSPLGAGVNGTPAGDHERRHRRLAD